MNILRFEMNVPNEIALQSTQGTLVQGRFGDRVMFYLVDGRVMYVPPAAAKIIEEEKIAPGECFEMCKARVAVGRRRSIDWRVRRKEPSTCDSPSETQLESDLRKSIEAAAGNKLQLQPDRHNCNRATATSPPAAVVANGHAPASTKLEHALKSAISAACNAEKFGAEMGYVVRFDSDAIKSMAITVLINMSEGNRR